MTRAGFLLAALALGGCSTAPAYVRPETTVPPLWPTGEAYPAQAGIAADLASYREVFRDPRLQTLTELALVNNRDLRIAAANLAAARAQVRIVRAAQFPEIGTGASATVEADGPDRFAFNGGMSSFEIDLFGRLANATAAERERALSTEAAARTVRVGLIADLALAWASYAANAELLDIARETAASARRSVALTSARLEGGIAPRTDLRQAEQILATAEGEVALRITALAQDENLMRLLVGGPVDPALLPRSLAEANAGIATLPAGVSSDVLLRRPDVIEAEYLLRAANADIAVARAELFPRISLTGLLGLASDALGALFSGGAFSASAGLDVGYAIFDGGRRRANVAVTQAQRDAALAAYQRSIQIAFREVADTLAVRGTIAERVRAASANTAAAADTARLTEARYRGGIDSFLGNLDAQRTLFSAQQAEAAIRLAEIENRIALYRVLGGDQFEC